MQHLVVLRGFARYVFLVKFFENRSSPESRSNVFSIVIVYIIGCEMKPSGGYVDEEA